MNSYEIRQADRKERLEAAAEKQRQEAQRRYKSFTSTMDMIPLGQPILVGHHSEGRHRADIKRMDGHLHAMVEANKKADELDARAAGVGRAGISADDPDAISKLRENLAAMEAEQADMKTCNAAFKKSGPAALASFDAAIQKEALRNFQFSPGGTKLPFPGYCLSNNNANIRRVRERIERLEAEDVERAKVRATLAEETGADPYDAPFLVTKYAGFTVTEDTDENRLLVKFPERAPEKACEILKTHGFRWSPTRKAWSRQLNGNSRNTVKYWLREPLEALFAQETPTA